MTRPLWIDKLLTRLKSTFSGPHRLRSALLVVGIMFVVSIVFVGAWLFKLDRSISERFAEKRFASPVEFYSAPDEVHPGNRYPAGYFTLLFQRKAYTRRDFSQSMDAGDYSIWNGDQCRAFLGLNARPDAPNDAAILINECAVFVNRGGSRAMTQATPNERGQIIALDKDGRVIATYDREDHHAVDAAVIEPELFAQYYGEKPILRKVVTFASGDVPPLCLNALLSIEDAQFYEHPGVSVTGLLRSVLTDLRTRRATQGGSTITQQLVKNYFLTNERTLKRKVTEIAMAFLVEQHATKDEILETYINLIYMGQNGPFEVRGFAAAAEHYFGKSLRELDLPECALLAAVLNGPGVYDPVIHPDRALKRRALVLERMQATKIIDGRAVTEANAAPLPKRPPRSLTEPAPYFVQAVRRELDKRSIETADGLRVYTTLNLRAQEAAQQSVRSGLDRLETNYAGLKKIKASGKNLEAVLVAADPHTGFIEALVGGRGFQATQYNRATDSRRQVGSVMKPFVYLTALETNAEDGKPYGPLTLLKDKSTPIKYEGQTWTPKNYEGIANGDVPLYWALKESLNIATANLGMSVGLDNIVETARRMGIQSKITPLPSLTLGAFELSPLEVLQGYGSIATMGRKIPLSLIARVEDLVGKELYTFQPVEEQVAAPEPTAELIGVMKQTLISGTGRGARLAGFTNPAAGKTGTTNDKKDSWFAGFTPHHVAVVWVGYDDNTSHNLTGATGAVPIWATYMKEFAGSQPPDDFVWPEGVEVATLSPEQQITAGAPHDEKNGSEKPVSEPLTLVFKKGLAPPPAPSVPDPSAAPATNPFKLPGN